MGKYLLVINGAVLLGSAFFIADSEARTTVITALLLFLPLLDRRGKNDLNQSFRNNIFIWLLLTGCYLIILVLHQHYVVTALSIIFLTALPEEWFFRYYFLHRLELYSASFWRANIICSVLFAISHIPTQGMFGLLTFFPSLVFGYVYQTSRNLILVILLHALANLVFLIYISAWLVANH